jgi:mono/diheme cytochrome c family protein
MALLFASGRVAPAARSPVRGNVAVGKALFVRPGLFCNSCHALKAVGSTGRDGPNLDKTKPSYARIVTIVTLGRNPSRRWPTGMPGYAAHYKELTGAEIRDIAAFVYTATHR